MPRLLPNNRYPRTSAKTPTMTSCCIMFSVHETLCSDPRLLLPVVDLSACPTCDTLPRHLFLFLHLNSQSDTDPQGFLPTTTESTRTTNPKTALDTEKFLLDPWLSCVVGWVRHMAL